MKKINKYLKSNILTTSGVILGLIAGILYWKFVGCKSGTCPITSSWYGSAIYGALLGGLILSLFEKNDKKKVKKEIDENSN